MATKFVKVVTSDSGVGLGTKVTDLDSGKDIPAVVSIEVPRFGAEDPIRINLELHAEMEITGIPRFLVADPKTSKLREVKSITFADGETVEF